MEISTFLGLLKCKEQSGEIFFSPRCSTEAVDCRLCTRLVCGIHIDVKGSSSCRTKVECASRNGAGHGWKKKEGGLLRFSRWRINTASIAVEGTVWRKWFSCWFLSHPKETIEKKNPKCIAYKIKILGSCFTLQWGTQEPQEQDTHFCVACMILCPLSTLNQIHSICRLWWDSPKHCSSHDTKPVSFSAQTALSEFRSWKLGGFYCVLSHQLSFFISLSIIMDIMRNIYFNLDFCKSVWTILLCKRSRT